MTSSHVHARAAEIVAGLTRDERVEVVSGRDMWHVGGITSSGVPVVTVADGPNGLRKQTSATVGMSQSVPATCFPTASTLACSWDPGLTEEIGHAIGEEARAERVSVILGPGLNLKRHPCCGRNFEYYSEDPLLSGAMAAGMVRGIQSVGVAACLKHFAVNNQETHRMVIDTIVDERTLRELYLAGFEHAVKTSEPRTVMCAYNRINGRYCSDDGWLLNDTLRREWGFEGLVMSDWGATNDRVASLKAGLDLEMPGSGGANAAVIRRALDEGRLAEEDLDAAATRVVELALEYGDSERGADPVEGYDADAHHALARRAAAECTVLLSNDGILPLAAPGRVAVVGAFASAPRYQGSGSSQIVPTRLDCALDALRERLESSTQIVFEPAYDALTGTSDGAARDAAVAAAADAEVALVFVGLPPVAEAEVIDRPDMRLPRDHDLLVDAVCRANPHTVVVLCNGAPVEIDWAEQPAAIVEAYLGGQAGGSAIVDVLLGYAEPAGRLAETFPMRLSDVPADANFPGASRQVQYREGLNVGYRYFVTADAPVRYPFGHGMSYASFDYGALQLSSERVDARGNNEFSVEVSVSVTNTGSRRGAEVVQFYVADVASSCPRPAFELKRFKKLWLESGETAEARVSLDRRAFAFFDPATHDWQVERGEFEVLVGSSASAIHRRTRLVVESGSASGPGPGPGHAPAAVRAVADDVQFERMLGHAIPEPEPTLPYTRTSMIEDLDQTRRGRLVHRVIRRALGDLGDLAESDPVIAMTLDRAMAELPLRGVVLMSAGKVSWRVLDAVIAALNWPRRRRGTRDGARL